MYARRGLVTLQVAWIRQNSGDQAGAWKSRLTPRGSDMEITVLEPDGVVFIDLEMEYLLVLPEISMLNSILIFLNLFHIQIYLHTLLVQCFISK